MTNHPKKNPYNFIFYFVVLSVFISIWIPLFYFYSVKAPHATPELVEKSRKIFDKDLMSEYEKRYLIYKLPWQDQKELIRVADKILEGKLSWIDGKIYEIDIPPKWSSIRKLLPNHELFMQCLMVPRILLHVYRITNNNIYLESARDVILDWYKFDNKVLVPQSLHWNDHAMAERMFVFGDFWSVYSINKIYDARVGEIIIN